MTNQLDLGELADIVGGENVGPPQEPRRASVDGLVPRVVARPGSYDEVAEVMRYANAAGLAVVPRGSGYLMHIGNTPVRYDIALELSRLNRIVEHEPADMTVTCQAGTTVAELNARLEPAGQLVPFSENPTDPCSVGGLLAADYSLMRLSHGRPRDFTIGLMVVTADGKLTKAGGRVVKNVAGYDLCKLYIGSLGTLGVIVEATFKVAPLPAERRASGYEFTSLADACRLSSEVLRRGLSLWRLEIGRRMSPGDGRFLAESGYLLHVVLAGSAAAVERSSRDVDTMARETGAAPLKADEDERPEERPQLPEWVYAEEPLTCVASVPPSAVPELVDRFEEAAPGAFLDIEPTNGRMSATWLGAREQKRLVERLRGDAQALGGSLVVQGCSTDLKREIDVFGEPPSGFALMREVKRRFDPNGILSPGRFAGRL